MMICLEIILWKMIREHIMPPASDQLLKDLGMRFRKARMAAGLSQQQIAQRAKISRPRYRDIETGVAAARATTLVNSGAVSVGSDRMRARGPHCVLVL
ncbi:DNA-binding XRE family transcriptional regulator [Bradyrhizobium sp. LM6.10]